MNTEEGTPQLTKGPQQNSTQPTNVDSLNQAKAPFSSARSGSQQKDFPGEQPQISAPIVTTGGSDHSQQENFFLSPDSRPDPFLEELGLSTLSRQQGWATPSQRMQSSSQDVRKPDPLSPGSTFSTHPGVRAGKPPKFESRQDHEVQNTPGALLRQNHHNQQGYGMRPPFNMGLREFGTDGRYLRDDLDDPRLSNDLMNGLAFPPEDPSIEGLGLPSHRQDGHRIFEEGPRGVPEELPGLGSKNLLPEDELLYPSNYGSQEGFHRLSMQSSHNDARGDRLMPSPYAFRGHARPRPGGHPQHLDDPMYGRLPMQGEGRDSVYSRMSALHMHRSASDGYLRNSMPARESSLHSHDTGSGELRGRSGSGMQEEASYRQNPAQDHARGLLAAARMNETPDFAMIYAFLGSMFDPVCHMIDHADVMNQMNAVDRETTNLILANCVHNLSIPEFSEHVLYYSLRANSNGRMRAPMNVNPGYGQGPHGRHPLHH